MTTTKRKQWEHESFYYTALNWRYCTECDQPLSVPEAIDLAKNQRLEICRKCGSVVDITAV